MADQSERGGGEGREGQAAGPEGLCGGGLGLFFLDGW